ncbi:MULTISPECIES: cytochrome c family protein [unclassified Ruegeria]|uniref:c-type cytochrome n=1 Tax=unclassified Ruegeria TaxID=2625375 RepID=UPI001489EF24|nr:MULTISPECIES: cytochrome C [unclassified Ruegeria]NOD63975.1 cytochrome C [Ruegeria sp. HKCCD6109]NOD94062.1 cytochrome C [Ruegeria sp. HKCCD4884]
MSKTLLTTALLTLVLSTQTLAAGDPEKGKAMYNRCSSCHAIIKDGKVLVKGGITGPNLYGVIGRVAGSENDYRYGSERLPIGMFTDDMIRAGEEGLVWTEENIAAYSKDPIGFIKDYLDDDTARPNMSVKLKKGAEDIAAYLATFSQ